MVRDFGCTGTLGNRARLIIASNRGPVEHYLEGGLVRTRAAGGGLAVALASVAQRTPVTWFATGSLPGDDVNAGKRLPLGASSELVLLSLPEEVRHQYYRVFANPILWFVQHGLTGLLEPGDLASAAIHSWARGYEPVNRAFARAIAGEASRRRDNPLIMLHDYHLYLAPRLLRNVRPHAAIQHFIHIPWPSPEAWGVLPNEVVRQICEGLLGNDSVVFQTEESACNFLETCRAYLRSQACICDGRHCVSLQGHTTRVWSNPISVDLHELEGQRCSAPVLRYLEELQPFTAERTIVRVDRLDPSKNILSGFEAYDRLLAANPDLQGRVTFLAFLVPSRTGIPEYDGYARAVFALVDRINRRFGREGWRPVHVFHEENRPRALAGLCLYDVLLVNSVADGLNLVAKEGPVVNERDGVLVLSKRAGAYEELNGGALGVDPLDIDATALALERALRMTADERASRARVLRCSIAAHQLDDWLGLLLNDLAVTEARKARERGPARLAAVR